MTTVAVLSNCKICVFGGQREYPPPHLHVKGPDSRCTIDLSTREVMKGRISRKDHREVTDWLSEGENYVATVTEWNRLNERERD